MNDCDEIRNLVGWFCLRAGQDDLLGPIFTGLDSDGGRETLLHYWCKTFGGESFDEQKELPPHIGRMFSVQHFYRWRTLFLETIDLHCPPHIAGKARIVVIRKSEEFLSKLELTRF